MNGRIFWLGLIAGLAIAPTSWAQAPALPGAPVGAGAAAIPGAPAAPAPAAPANLWSFLCPTPQQTAAVKTCFCNSPLGQMINSAGAPMAAMTGGLMGGCCAQNSLLNNLMKAADDPGGLAARVKADEEDAKVRRAAVRFLGTVDCNRWPEAIDVLKTALRKDRNECVRFEAALALRNGCCCNNEIIDALKNCILGENKTDPAPVEKSDRVRAVAAEALVLCPMMQKEQKKDERLLKPGPNPITDPEEYYRKVAQMPREEMVASARAALVSLQKGGKAPAAGAEAAGAANAPTAPAIQPRDNSLSGIFTSALAAPANGPRQPFFTNLTKTLTGNQEAVGAKRQESVAPAPKETVPPPTKPADPVPAPRPLFISGVLPELPTENRAGPRPPFTSGVLPELPTESRAAPPLITVASPADPVASPPPKPAPLVTIQLKAPNQATLGTRAMFEIRVANHSSQPLNGVTLYGWLPENLNHPQGQVIKGDVDVKIAPGQVKTLRLPTSAVKPGRGTVRIKVATSAGEAWGDEEIVIPPSQTLHRSVVPVENAPATAGGGSGVGQPRATRPISSISIIQIVPSSDMPANGPRESVGSVTVESVPPASDGVLPEAVLPRR